MRTAATDTLGCRLNQADTALLATRLRQAGYSLVVSNTDDVDASTPPPDIIVINTCTVTANAARKSRQLVRKRRKQFPNALIVVTGCDVANDLAKWKAASEADIVISNDDKPMLSNILLKRLSTHSPPASRVDTDRNLEVPAEYATAGLTVFRENAAATFPFRTKAYVKVQEGCDSFCSYCIVPHVRGRERSRDRAEIIAEARQLLTEGHKELVVTGVNISAYDDNGVRIADLLAELAAIPGDFRIRLSSMEPHKENLNLIKLIKETPKICRFLHVPLQHGADEILEAMNRPRETAEFAEFLTRAAREIRGIHLGTDIIVGFPGETDELFEKSMKFLSGLPLANIHVFAFSPREGTPAATFPNQVPGGMAKARATRLKHLSATLSAKFAASQYNVSQQVLLEKRTSDTTLEGWSDNYIRVEIDDPSANPGDLISTTLWRPVSN